MKITPWKATYSFRKFRQRTGGLSEFYWTQQLATDCLTDRLKGEASNRQPREIFTCSFDERMYQKTNAEALASLPEFMNQSRLHLLVIFAAYLESYLTESAFSFLLSKGHGENVDNPDKKIKLNKVGEAIGKPLLQNSTIPDMIDYASELFKVELGAHANVWKKMYRIRCAVAHNGGFATPRFIQDIGGSGQLHLRPKIYDKLGLTWEELRLALRYGDEIASLIDNKIATYEVRIAEVEILLRELKSVKLLPDKDQLFTILHDKYSLHPIRKVEKRQILWKFY